MDVCFFAWVVMLVWVMHMLFSTVIAVLSELRLLRQKSILALSIQEEVKGGRSNGDSVGGSLCMDPRCVLVSASQATRPLL